jgi:hypothetical protein
LVNFYPKDQSLILYEPIPQIHLPLRSTLRRYLLCEICLDPGAIHVMISVETSTAKHVATSSLAADFKPFQEKDRSQNPSLDGPSLDTSNGRLDPPNDAKDRAIALVLFEREFIDELRRATGT